MSPAGDRDQLDLGLGPAAEEGAETAAGTAAVASPDADPGRPPPSEEQRAVLRFGTDLVVTAGAGSGKTRTLVELYRRILEDPPRAGIDPAGFGPGRMLCLTFTERAARQIQERIRERVAEPEVQRELESAPITTFHGWCAGLLRDHPLEAGVDPRFGVLSEEAAGEALQGAAVDALREGLSGGDEAARRAVELLGLGGAAGTVASLVADARTAGWSPREPIARFEARIEEVDRSRRGPLADAVTEAGRRLRMAARSTDLTRKGRSLRREYEAAWERWSEDPSAEAARALGAASKAAARSWRARFDRATELRRELEGAVEAYLAACREVEDRFQLGAWPALAVTVRGAYRAARTGRGALDYDDLLLRTRALLREHDDLRRALRRRYRVILVDEHQDTDPVQDGILRLLVGEGALEGERSPGAPRWCVVGDAQQSIYGFRGATVAAFAELAGRAAERGAHRTLRTNYRSDGALVSFYNAFFPDVLAGGERPDQVAYVRQRAHRAASEKPAVAWLAPPDPSPPAAEARELEARALAARLAAGLDPGSPHALEIRDPESGEARIARPGDVAVLLRRLTRVEPYRRALDAVGLESVVVGSGSFYARQETFDVLNALEAALFPGDPVPAVAFLRSPMVGLPDDVLWRLLRDREAEDGAREILFGEDSGEELDEETAAALARARTILAELRARADTEPPATTVAWLIDRTGYAAVLDALPDRLQRRANLERLVELADRAPGEGEALLARWTASLRRRVEHPPAERDASPRETGDRVQVMTIHRAKGLEFPVVALADLGGRGRRRTSRVLLDPDLGVVAQSWPHPGAKPLPTASHRAAKEARRARERAEEARLLYVAATRAMDRLLLSAGAAGHWWLDRLRAFAGSDRAAGVLHTASIEPWAGRFASSLGQAPPIADPGVPRPDPLPAAAGEIAARELAAATVGETTRGRSGAAARTASRAALRRGRVGHAALERLPLDPTPGFELEAWLETAVGVDASGIEALAGFVERIVRPALEGADEVLREHPFRLRLPPVEGEPASRAGVVVGAIDCVWRDREGEWRVWDYKFAAEDGRSDVHEAQLAVYALAAATALGLERIRGALLYVEDGAVRERTWDASALAALEARLAEAFPHDDTGAA